MDYLMTSIHFCEFQVDFAFDKWHLSPLFKEETVSLSDPAILSSLAGIFRDVLDNFSASPERWAQIAKRTTRHDGSHLNLAGFLRTKMCCGFDLPKEEPTKT